MQNRFFAILFLIAVPLVSKYYSHLFKSQPGPMPALPSYSEKSQALSFGDPNQSNPALDLPRKPSVPEDPSTLQFSSLKSR